jgi:hypothetical protein
MVFSSGKIVRRVLASKGSAELKVLRINIPSMADAASSTRISSAQANGEIVATLTGNVAAVRHIVEKAIVNPETAPSSTTTS